MTEGSIEVQEQLHVVITWRRGDPWWASIERTYAPLLAGEPAIADSSGRLLA